MTRVGSFCALVCLAIVASSHGIENVQATETEEEVVGMFGPFEPLVLNTTTDLQYLLVKIGEYAVDPFQSLFTGLWTNWYLESDIRDQLAKLAVTRDILDRFALWGTYLDEIPGSDQVECTEHDKFVRRLDGSCNDFSDPLMGAAWTRFHRNINPLSEAAKQDPNILEPNPRDISRILLGRQRGEMKKVEFFNMLGVAWIQFITHDWFSHGDNREDDYFEVPLSRGDPLRTWYRRTLKVRKTRADETRTPIDEALLGPTHLNEVTHFFDGSQVYGSDEETADRLREFSGGRLKLDENGLLPLGEGGYDDTGFRRNYWVGISLLHTAFAREHNAIAEMLEDAYPDWDDQKLYDTARMINAALMVKIHTLEWTPAILPNRGLDAAMKTNWDGLNQFFQPPLLGLPPGLPESLGPILFGLKNSPRDLKTYPTAQDLISVGVEPAQAEQIAAVFNGSIPYAMPEEFVSIYRMHPLLPEYLTVKDAIEDDEDESSWWSKLPKWLRDWLRPKKFSISDSRDKGSRVLVEKHGLIDLLYTFGTEHAGALSLRNYPNDLQNIYIPGVGYMDLGTVDIIRDRERGIPRYNELRRQIFLKPIESFEDLTDDPELLAALKLVYGDGPDAVEKLDTFVGTLAETQRPTNFGFGETLFQIFIVFASRRISADRFLTDDFTPEVYTPEGIDWIETQSMKSVLLRNFPDLEETELANVFNAFAPWDGP